MQRVPLFAFLFLLLVAIPIVQPAWAQFNGQKIVDDIRAAYERLDFTEANTRIDEALGMYQLFEPGHLSDIHVVYALILFSRNEASAAESQLVKALQLKPALVLNPLDTPPALLEIFQSLKAIQQNPIDTSKTEPAEIRYILVEDLRPGAAVRSMLVPGWGHLYKGEQKKGILLAGAWAVTAGGTLIAQVNRNQARDHYLASENAVAKLQNRFRAYSKLA